jgi:hypothetical protein
MPVTGRVVVDVPGVEHDGAIVGVVHEQADAVHGPALGQARLVEDGPGEGGGLGEEVSRVVQAVLPVEALADALFATSNVTALAVATAMARRREATASTVSFILYACT